MLRCVFAVRIILNVAARRIFDCYPGIIPPMFLINTVHNKFCGTGVDVGSLQLPCVRKTFVFAFHC
eukprot:COSAG01_NODE_46704_length_397_cov_2.788591_2_plen_65_part_01